MHEHRANELLQPVHGWMGDSAWIGWAVGILIILRLGILIIKLPRK